MQAFSDGPKNLLSSKTANKHGLEAKDHPLLVELKH